MLLSWPHPSALVAYNSGTNIGHGPVKTLFLGLILCLGQMAPCDTMLYCILLAYIYYIGPIPVPWWPMMVAVTLPMALSGLFFLSLILFPVVAHWMLAMAL